MVRCCIPEDLVVGILLSFPSMVVLCALDSFQSHGALVFPILPLFTSSCSPIVIASGVQSSFFIKFSNTERKIYTILSDDTLQISTLRDLPTFVGCSNGLLCVSINSRWSSFMLWNPALSGIKFIPEPYPTSAGYFFKAAEGFGIDPKTEDFKVVRIWHKWPEEIDGFDNFIVRVYSVKNDSWKELDVSPPTNTIIPCKFIGFKSGGMRHAYHWWANDGNSDIPIHSVVSFDMTTEMFRKTLLPDDFVALNFGSQFISFYQLENSLAMIRTIHDLVIGDSTQEIWILLEYGIKESWLKLYTLQLGGLHRLVKPLQFRRNGKEVLVADDGKILLWDPPTQKITTLPIQMNIVEIFNFETILYKKS